MSTFQLVFRGKLLTGFAPEQVQEKLMHMFKIDEARARGALAQSKWTIKTGLSKEQAQLFQQRFRDIGMLVMAIADDTIAPTIADPSPSKPPPVAQNPVDQSPPQATQSAVVKGEPDYAALEKAALEIARQEAALRKAQFKPRSVEQAPTSVVNLSQTTKVFATPAGGLAAIEESTEPLVKKPHVKEFQTDLSAYSLAAEGAVLDAGKRTSARAIDTSSLSLSAEGTALQETKVVKKAEIDTSGLSLSTEPVVEKPLSPLWSELG